MSKRFRASLLVVFATVGVACRSETIFAPEPPAAVEEWRTIGKYQFTGVVTSGGWGEDLRDARYTGFLTVEELEPATGKLRGVLGDLRFVTAAENSESTTRFMTGSLRKAEVRLGTAEGTFFMSGAILESGNMAGTWGCCAIGDYRGTFTATRMSP